MKFSAKGAELLKKTFHDAKAQGGLSGKPVEEAYMTDLLQAMISLNYRLDPVLVHGGWVEVDTVSDLNSQVTRSRLQKIADTL
jgi:L-glutamine-phosphate cytidylyltransferase